MTSETVMISRIDHVSIAVNDYKKAANFFQNVFGAIPGLKGIEDNLNFLWHVFSLGDLTRLEIIEPSGENSFLESFLEDKKDGGVHHITFETPDIRIAKKTLEEKNIPYFGYNENDEIWKELFIHPKDAFGVLIQIAEFNPDDYLGKSEKLPRDQKWSVQKKESGCSLSFAHPGGGKATIELSEDEIKQLIKDLSN